MVCISPQVSHVVGKKGARAYHGGMSHGQRRAVHHAFIRDEIQARTLFRFFLLSFFPNAIAVM